MHLIIGANKDKQYRKPEISLAQEEDNFFFGSKLWGNSYSSNYYTCWNFSKTPVTWLKDNS